MTNDQYSERKVHYAKLSGCGKPCIEVVLAEYFEADPLVVEFFTEKTLLFRRRSRLSTPAPASGVYVSTGADQVVYFHFDSRWLEIGLN